MITTLSPEEITLRLDIGIKIVKEAGALAHNAFKAMTPEQIKFKGPQDFLTETDTLVEALIKQRLNAELPQDNVYGEETGGEVGENAWIIDPIDGTANFARTIPHFCIVLAFVSGEDTQIGIIYDPCHDELYVAKKGEGATLNDKPISVSETSSFEIANVELGWSNRISHDRYMQTLGNFIQLGSNVRRSACGALALAYVASGRTDAYVEGHMNPWDCVAGMLLVKEAGGEINDFYRNKNWVSGGAVLASNKPLSLSISEASGIAL